ncbi:MAG: hypothetical protein ACXABY_04285 [Candidatus Thorarchaeota archaeon]
MTFSPWVLLWLVVGIGLGIKNLIVGQKDVRPIGQQPYAGHHWEREHVDRMFHD